MNDCRRSISPKTYERLVGAASGLGALNSKPHETRRCSVRELIETALDARKTCQETATVWRTEANGD